jgi:hypothetical protein
MPYANEVEEIVHGQWDSEGLFTANGIWSYPDFLRGVGMDRKMLRDDQWERIEQLLPGQGH